MSDTHCWSQGHREQVLALLAALKIDPRGVTGITIRIHVNAISMVEIERHLENGQIEAFTEVLKGYGEENPFAEEDDPPVNASDQAVQKASLKP